MEILRLKEMLEKENIPFEFVKRCEDDKVIDWGYQIGYPILPCNANDEKEFICSAIQGYGSYGYEQDKIEIMGLLTEKEKEHDAVAGFLTADDVFKRIKNHWFFNKEKYQKG